MELNEARAIAEEEAEMQFVFTGCVMTSNEIEAMALDLVALDPFA